MTEKEELMYLKAILNCTGQHLVVRDSSGNVVYQLMDNTFVPVKTHELEKHNDKLIGVSEYDFMIGQEKLSLTTFQEYDQHRQDAFIKAFQSNFNQNRVDTLTALPLRDQLRRKVDCIKKGTQSYVIGMCDVDDFKRVNDTYGHQVGDEVLVHISKVLKSKLNKGIDFVCRYGGEEFVFLMPTDDVGLSIVQSEQLVEELSRIEEYSNASPFRCTVSVGLAKYKPEQEFSKVLRQADEALYIQKRNGKNGVTYYGDHVDEKSVLTSFEKK